MRVRRILLNPSHPHKHSSHNENVNGRMQNILRSRPSSDLKKTHRGPDNNSQHEEENGKRNYSGLIHNISLSFRVRRNTRTRQGEQAYS